MATSNYGRAVNHAHSISVRTQNNYGVRSGAIAVDKDPQSGKEVLSFGDESLLKASLACLQSLAFGEMHQRKNNVITAAYKTCTWLSRHPTYKKWYEQPHGFLWIKGHPGVGKSTLMKHVFEAERRSGKGVPASFFFDRRGVASQNTTFMIYRALLHQVLQQVPSLHKKFTSIFQQRCSAEGDWGEGWDWHENELQDFFRFEVREVAGVNKLRLYIDALDECDAKAINCLVGFLAILQDGISMCISCRHYPPVALEKGLEIHVEEENHQDIATYVTNIIGDRVSDQTAKEVLKASISDRSSNNFIWVDSAINQAVKMYKAGESLKTIQASIQEKSPDLEKLYEQSLNDIEDRTKPQSLRLFQWICFALEPLSLSELRYALIIDADTSVSSIRELEKSDDYLTTDSQMEKRLRYLSAGLAHVVHSRRHRVVRLYHQSVQDFLLDRGFRVLFDSHQHQAYSSSFAGRAHFQLSETCAKYLAMREIHDAYCQYFGLSEEAQETDCQPWTVDDILKNVRDKYPFLRYATLNVFWHAREADEAGIRIIDLLRNFSLHPKLLELWVEMEICFEKSSGCHDRNPCAGLSVIHVIILYNMVGALNDALDIGFEADSMDKWGRTPLFIAASEGHEVLVRLLLSRDDVDVNIQARREKEYQLKTQDSGTTTPISWLANRATRPATPLSVAVEGEYVSIVKMLLDRHDTNPNVKCCFAQTPLVLAVSKKCEEIVRLLLKRDDTDVNSRDCDGCTPLHFAALSGSEALVGMLLGRSEIDVNVRSWIGETPMMEAAIDGHEGVVKMLRARGANE